MMRVIDLANEETSLHKVSRSEQAGPCPKCRSTDSFHVQPEARDGMGAWMCRRCWEPSELISVNGQTRKRGWGDTIDYLRHFRGLSFKQAKALVEGDEGTAPTSETTPYTPYDVAPDAAWQQENALYARSCMESLWSEQGRDALAYLHGRGLDDETIRYAKLGYDASCWHTGAQGYVPCLIIPHFIEGQLWRVEMRDMRPNIDNDKRYRNVSGSSNYGLYNADVLLTRDAPVFLVEGAIDALTIQQEAGTHVLAVATGSTSGGRSLRWYTRLAIKPHVYVAFDNEQEADKRATHWLKALKNGERYKPLTHDANHMHTHGYSVRSWVLNALDDEPITASHVQSEADREAELRRYYERFRDYARRQQEIKWTLTPLHGGKAALSPLEACKTVGKCLKSDDFILVEQAKRMIDSMCSPH